MITATNTDVSAIYVAKYNRFVDTILSRINKILKDKYDPVTVKLTNLNSNNKSKNKSKNKNNNTNKNKKIKSMGRTDQSLVKNIVVVSSENEDKNQKPLQNIMNNVELMKLHTLTEVYF
jgi:hypothetical protein